MTKTHVSVDIDLPTYRAIEAARESFDETQSDIIWRLIHRATNNDLPPRSEMVAEFVEPKKAWIGDGGRVVLPHGTPLRMVYKGQEHRGEVVDGMIVAAGALFDNLSAAADHVTGVNLNGWQYWQAQLAGNWVKLNDLRRR